MEAGVLAQLRAGDPVIAALVNRPFRPASSEEYALTAIIAAPGPLTSDEVAARAISEGCTGQPQSITASLSTWYARAQGDWANVTRSKKGQSWFYAWDAATHRSPSEPKKARTAAAVKAPRAKPAVAKTPPVTGKRLPEGLYAKVLHDDGEIVVLLDQNGDLIRGRRLR